MPFKSIDYLAWYRSITGSVEFDVSSSCLMPVTSEELGLSLDDVRLSRPAGKESDRAFREILAGKYGVNPGQVLVVPGVTTGYFILFAAMLDRGHEILLEAPNYETLYRLPAYFQSTIKILERSEDRRFQIDLEQLERKVNKNTRAVIITNLHNPTGVSTNPEKLMTIGQLARDYKASVICSEVYLDNAFEGHHKPAATYGANMISLSGFSKVYGLPGLRIGWIVAHNEDLIARMTQIADYITGNGVSSPSLSIAELAMTKADQLLKRSRTIAQGNLKVVETWVRSRGDLDLIPPEGGTVCFVRLPQRVDDYKLTELLIKKYRTIVVPGSFFWAKRYIRVGIGGETSVLEGALKNVGSALDEMLSK